MDPETVMRYRVRLMSALGALAFLLAAPRSRLAFGLGFSIAFCGEALRIWAAGQLEKDRGLVTDGPYAMVRHPLYLGSNLLALGACVVATTPSHPARSLAVWALAAASLPWLYRAKVRREESELIRRSPAFAAYSRTVPSIVPDFRRLNRALGSTSFNPRRLFDNREHVTAAAVVLLAILLRFRQVYRW